jgi:hypothetical protein
MGAASVGEAASLLAGPKFRELWLSWTLSRAPRWAPEGTLRKFDNLYRFFGPAYRILEKQGPANYRCTETEKLDSSAMSFAFQGF